MNRINIDIEKEIELRLNSSCLGLFIARKKWNETIREILYKIISENYKGDFDCRFPGKTENFKECLFDFACYEYSYKEKFDNDLEISSYSRKNALLVAEIEWDMSFEDNIQPDFEKLLVARSDYRLMVFRTDNEQRAIDIFKYMDEIVDCFQLNNSSDRYFYVAGLNNENGRFITHLKVT